MLLYQIFGRIFWWTPPFPFKQGSLVAAAYCHLKLGNWSLAIEASEMVLEMDKQSTKALLVKAEALFNVCQVTFLTVTRIINKQHFKVKQ